LVAKLRNRFIETNATEPSGDARPEPRADVSFASNRVAKNLPDLLLSAAAVTASAALKLLLDIIVELANEELSHAANDITIAGFSRRMGLEL
jgi:hypothetical protein